MQVYNCFNIPEIFDEFTEELNIEVHTHRVNYPKFLDSRVIPTELRQQIINQLEQYLEDIKNKTHKNWTLDRKKNVSQHVLDAINMLSGGDMIEQLQSFIEFSDKLDKKQRVKKTWRQLLPKLEGYINEM